MSKNRVTFPSELIIRDGKVGIGTSSPSSTFNVLGSAEVTGEFKVTSVGSTAVEHIKIKHVIDNGGSIVYLTDGDEPLFSVSKDGEFAYVISDDDGKSILDITKAGITTIRESLSVGKNISVGNTIFPGSIQTPNVKFLSTGSSEATRITAKHYSNNLGSLVIQGEDSHLFSFDNEPDIYYSINDSEARAALTVSSSGITTIRDLFQNRVNFTSVGSTFGQQIQLNHYRNIAYQPAIGSTTNNSGAISFDSPAGISTDGITYFPASLFALTNGGGNIFSVSGYQYFSGSNTFPSIDVTQRGRVGLGTTNPSSDIHVFQRNIFIESSNVGLGVSATNIRLDVLGDVQFRTRVGLSQTGSPASNNVIDIQPANPGIFTTAPGASSVLTINRTNDGVNRAQLFTVENNDNTLFRVNVLGIGLTTVVTPTNPIYTAFDIGNSGDIRIFDTDASKIIRPFIAGFSSTIPSDGDMFRIDTYNPPFIGTFPTVTPAIRVDKFGYTEISRNVNQISGITTVGIATTTTSLDVNATMTFELINNTTLTIKVRGTDGVTRSGIVTLA
jgi:hypothetical protein